MHWYEAQSLGGVPRGADWKADCRLRVFIYEGDLFARLASAAVQVNPFRVVCV